MEPIMPMEHQTSSQPESFGAVPHNAEGSIAIPQASAKFRKLRNVKKTTH
jgi:hypothetical protein